MMKFNKILFKLWVMTNRFSLLAKLFQSDDKTFLFFFKVNTFIIRI